MNLAIMTFHDIIVCKLFVLDETTRNHMTIYGTMIDSKLFSLFTLNHIFL